MEFLHLAHHPFTFRDWNLTRLPLLGERKGNVNIGDHGKRDAGSWEIYTKEKRREKRKWDKKKGSTREGNELHARRTTRCNFCKAEINILPLKVSFAYNNLVGMTRNDGGTHAVEKSIIVFERIINLYKVLLIEETRNRVIWWLRRNIRCGPDHRRIEVESRYVYGFLCLSLLFFSRLLMLKAERSFVHLSRTYVCAPICYLIYLKHAPGEPAAGYRKAIFNKTMYLERWEKYP